MANKPLLHIFICLEKNTKMRWTDRWRDLQAMQMRCNYWAIVRW